MLTLTARNIRIVLAILAVALMVFGESAVARRGRAKGAGANGSNVRSQQSPNTARGSGIQRSRPANRVPGNVSRPARTAEPGFRNRARAARPGSRSSFRRTVSPLQEAAALGRSRSVVRMPSNAFGAGKRARGSFNAMKHARGSFDARKHARGSFDARKHARGSFDARKLARGSFNAGRLTRVRSNSRTTFRSRSMFTRPANERSQFVRPANERSQFGATADKSATNSLTTISGHGDRVFNRNSSHIGRQWHRRYHRWGHRGSRIYHRIVWPRYRHIVRYNYGRHFTFRYLHPYYHRRYIFVSLGGYWPIYYDYLRYFWYGYHPYTWYGYYPVPYEVKGDTYNYYTYNYGDSPGPAGYSQAADGIRPVDEDTFADVRERLAAEAAQEPAPETDADRYFEEAVEAFEAGDYDVAAKKLAEARELEPEDIVLPFAYVQALFADRQYSAAVEVLREAISQLPPDKEGVFFPRGLYPEDDALFGQIDQLAEKADLYPSDTDLQLLLGYQLLGVGKLDEAIEPLERAGQDPLNTASATKLLELLEKIRTQSAEDNSQ